MFRFVEAKEGEVKRWQRPLGEEFRLRSGNLRIRFRVDDDDTIIVLRVLPRDKAYRESTSFSHGSLNAFRVS